MSACTAQAALFMNGHFVTARFDGGKGESWWMISTFEDCSVLVSTLAVRRASTSIPEALSYWTIQRNNAVPHGSRFDACAAIVAQLNALDAGASSST